jgi:hypothetical protein
MSRTRRKIPEGKFYRTARYNGGNNKNNEDSRNNNQPRRYAISGRRERMRATMKPISVEYQGKPDPGWAIGTFKDVWNVGGNLPRAGRRISGWQLRSPDGVIRMREGNWEQFVPFANEVLSNYGCSTRIS